MNSTMIDVTVDRDDPALLHDQVAAQIRRAIADGEAKPGERLPPARHLAAVMHVNTNTVLRALRLLRDEGLLELRPGHGIRVTGTPQRSALLTKAIELVKLSRESGYDRVELLDMIQQLP
jgi:GntR family transcriptional regulator